MAEVLVLIGLLMALLVGALTWVAAWRYGRQRALVVPVLALAAGGLMLWRAPELGHMPAMDMAYVAMALIGPTVGGALLGLALARRKS